MNFIAIIIDWIIIVLSYVLARTSRKIYFGEKYIDLNNPSIYNKYRGDTVSMNNLFIIAGVIGFIVIGISVFKKKNICKLLYKRITIYVFFCTFSLCLQSLIKKFIISFRPDFMEVCNFDYELLAKDNMLKNITEGDMRKRLVPISYCRADPKKLRSSEMGSFPSGHALIICSTMTYCSYLLYTTLKNKNFGSVIKPLIVFIPIIIAIVLSISRITDHRHHPIDVFAGMSIGIFLTISTLLIKKKNEVEKVEKVEKTDKIEKVIINYK